MSKSALFLHLREQIQEAQTDTELDRIIETAFSEYMKDNLTYEEYGKVYFAAIRQINDIECGKWLNKRRVGVTVARQALNL